MVRKSRPVLCFALVSFACIARGVVPRYVAAASGPKDVVLVLDVSHSMTAPSGSLSSSDKTRLDMMKEAAKEVIYNTLTNADHVSVVSGCQLAVFAAVRQYYFFVSFPSPLHFQTLLYAI